MDAWAHTKGYKVRLKAGGSSSGAASASRTLRRLRQSASAPGFGWQATSFTDVSDRSQWIQQQVEMMLGEHAKRVTQDLHENLHVVRQRVGSSSDVIFRTFETSDHPPLRAGLVYVEGLSNVSALSQHILRALMHLSLRQEMRRVTPDGIFHQVKNHLISLAQVKTTTAFEDAVEPLMAGDGVLFVDGCDRAFLLGARQFEHRSIESPSTESTIRGPREAFIEPIRSNTSLLRRRLNTPALRIENLQIGRRSKTEVAICYLADLASPDLVLEVKRRLKAIDIDAVQESGYLEQFIEDNHYSPFPQTLISERPDVVAGSLLEGRVAVITDGTPFVMVVPGVFSMFYQSSEDYYERYSLSNLVRGIRLLSLVMSLVFSSLYVSLVSFNPEMIPTKFAVAVAGGRSGVPVPAVVEVLALELVMEVLREASLHLPKQIGSAISIVGILVIGQAAVSSGFVSPITVVIVAATAIGSFATPAFNAASALRLLRFPLILLAGMFGLYGVLVGLIVIVNHMLSLESFGVPYLQPIAPLNPRALRDTFIRAPLWLLNKRPQSTQPQDRIRMANRQPGVLDAKRPVLDPSRGQGGEAP